MAYTEIAGTDPADVVVREKIPANFAALRSGEAGSTAPANPVAHMTWPDTANGLLKRRNAGNTDWDVIGAISDDASRQIFVVDIGIATATGGKVLFAAPRSVHVESVTLLAESTSHDASNYYSFQVRNVTQSQDLVATPVATEPDPGAGNIATETPYLIATDQNQVVASGDVLKLNWTKTGSPGDIANLVAQISYVAR